MVTATAGTQGLRVGFPPGCATVDDRRAAGRAARQHVPRRALAAWQPSDRAHDAVQTLRAQNAIRLPELESLRFDRMTESPWSFYRGAAAVMAADLAVEPHTDLEVQMCGDAHALNFGLWATPERNLSFDLRDFDETLRGPFEWDVKRFVASLIVLAREVGLSAGAADEAVAVATRSYRERMQSYADANELDIWYDLITVDQLLDVFDAPARERVATVVEKQARKRTSRGAYKKLTEIVDGHPRIIEDPPRRVRVSADGEPEMVRSVLERYRMSLREDRRHLLDRFTVVDWVRQVVGVGSVGMRVFLVLSEGRSADDPLFLQLKQAGPSVYEAALKPSPLDNHGARVVAGQRLLQSATDILVGWTTVGPYDFYVRQFRDMKVIPTTDTIGPYLEEFAMKCGAVLARAHAKSGDPVAIASYIGKGSRFDDALATFARAYADQTERDRDQLAASRRS